MNLMNVFVGAPASKWAGIAALVSLLVVGVVILVSKDAIPVSQKFAVVLILFLMSLPGILLTLFQLTCLVTGAGLKNQRPWCWAFAWLMSGLMILYSAMIVVVAIMSLSSDRAVDTLTSVMSPEGFQEANTMATMMLEESEKELKERFQADKMPTEEELKKLEADAAPELEGFHTHTKERFTAAKPERFQAPKHERFQAGAMVEEEEMPSASSPETFRGSCAGAPL